MVSLTQWPGSCLLPINSSLLLRTPMALCAQARLSELEAATPTSPHQLPPSHLSLALVPVWKILTDFHPPTRIPLGADFQNSVTKLCCFLLISSYSNTHPQNIVGSFFPYWDQHV